MCGSGKGYLCFYDTNRGKYEIIKKCYRDWTNYLMKISEGIIISCSHDKTIKFGNINYYKFKSMNKCFQIQICKKIKIYLYFFNKVINNRKFFKIKMYIYKFNY